MTPEQLKAIVQTLEKAGYQFPATCSNGFLCIIDPTCIWTPLLEFIHTAWIILSVVTALLLIGWGVTMLRGASHDIVKNLRTLVLIFGALSVALPAVKFLGGDKVVINQCNVIKIPTSELQELVNAQHKTLEQNNYEYFDVQDSAYDDTNEFNDVE